MATLPLATAKRHPPFRAGHRRGKITTKITREKKKMQIIKTGSLWPRTGFYSNSLFARKSPAAALPASGSPPACRGSFFPAFEPRATFSFAGCFIAIFPTKKISFKKIAIYSRNSTLQSSISHSPHALVPELANKPTKSHF